MGKRLNELLTYAGAFLAAWGAGVWATPEDAKWRILVVLAPLEAVFLFGVYSVLYLVHAVVFFPTRDECIEELKADVREARAGLEALGFDTSYMDKNGELDKKTN